MWCEWYASLLYCFVIRGTRRNNPCCAWTSIAWTFQSIFKMSAISGSPHSIITPRRIFQSRVGLEATFPNVTFGLVTTFTDVHRDGKIENHVIFSNGVWQSTKPCYLATVPTEIQNRVIFSNGVSLTLACVAHTSSHLLKEDVSVSSVFDVSTLINLSLGFNNLSLRSLPATFTDPVKQTYNVTIIHTTTVNRRNVNQVHV